MSVGPLAPAVLAATCVALAAYGAVLVAGAPATDRLRATGAEEQGSVSERAVRAVGRPVASLVIGHSSAYRDMVSRWLAYSGRQKDTVTSFTERYAGLVVVCLCLALVAAGTGARWFAVTTVVLATTIPPVQLARESAARQRRIENSMPGFLELMAVLLASGLTFRHALQRVTARSTGPLIDEMRLLLNQLELGWTPRDALDALASRTGAPTVRRLASSARMNAELGVPIAATLSNMAEEVRADALVELRIRAKRAADRGGVVLVFLVLPGVLGLTMGILVSEAVETFATFTG